MRTASMQANLIDASEYIYEGTFCGGILAPMTEWTQKSHGPQRGVPSEGWEKLEETIAIFGTKKTGESSEVPLISAIVIAVILQNSGFRSHQCFE